MPNFFIRYWRVVRFVPSRAAAPAGRAMTQFVSLKGMLRNNRTRFKVIDSFLTNVCNTRNIQHVVLLLFCRFNFLRQSPVHERVKKSPVAET
jgi:hypothetical protein